jgi:membrane protein
MAAVSALWSFGGLGWQELGRRLWRQTFLCDIFGRCAELAYYFFFAIFPLLFFLTTLLGYLAEASAQLRSSLFDYLATVSPSPEVTALLHSILDQVTRRRGGAKLSLSLAAAVWVASNGMIAISRTLNTACGIAESRPWWWRRLIAILLTVLVSVLVVTALVMIFYGGEIGEALAVRLGIGSVFVSAWRWLQLPVSLAFLLLAFEAVYNFAPDLGQRAGRHWGTPGAVSGVALWLAASFGLRLYLAYARSYAVTYGSLGAVILLLIWFYVSAFAILAGGIVNSELAQAIAARRRAQRARAPLARGKAARRRRRT